MFCYFSSFFFSFFIIDGLTVSDQILEVEIKSEAYLKSGMMDTPLCQLQEIRQMDAYSENYRKATHI